MRRVRRHPVVTTVSVVLGLTYLTVLVRLNFKTRNEQIWLGKSWNDIGNLLPLDENASENCNSRDTILNNQPFVPDEAKSVIVLTYQRCGSSFFGQMFNTNPDIFYMYEPLDSLYSSLYGTMQGWNVPSDITSYWNGTQRSLPDLEVVAVSTFLQQLLSCEINSLPTDTLVHNYWTGFDKQFTTASKYIQCLRNTSLDSSICNRQNPYYCGQRFGQRPEDHLKHCYHLLKDGSGKFPGVPVTVQHKYSTYRSCMRLIRQNIDQQCTSLLANICQRRNIRATKTVRATMSSMESLLQQRQNFRIIHLIRDPRGVVLSRRDKDPSVVGKYSMQNHASDVLVREAELYCRTVVADIKLRKTLEKNHPGRIYTIFFEDAANNISKAVENVYRFLNISVAENTRMWAKNNKVERSSKIAKRWESDLTVSQNNRILETCQEFYELTDPQRCS